VHARGKEGGLEEFARSRAENVVEKLEARSGLLAGGQQVFATRLAGR